MLISSCCAGRLKSERPVNVLLSPLGDGGRERGPTGGLTESGQYHDGRSLTLSFPLWMLKACFLPLIALARLKYIWSSCTEWMWVSYQKSTSVRGCAVCGLLIVIFSHQKESYAVIQHEKSRVNSVKVIPVMQTSSYCKDIYSKHFCNILQKHSVNLLYSALS